jgi:ribose transport system permease protein
MGETGSSPAKVTGKELLRESRLGDVTRKLSRDYAVLAALVLMFFVFVALKPGIFLSLNTVVAILSSQAALIIATLGLTVTLVVNEFDLTVGGVLVLTDTVVAVLTYKYHWGLAPAMIVAVLMGTSVGLFNSLLVVKLGMNSFIATLGVSTLLTGVALVLAGSTIVANTPDALAAIATHKLFGIPLSVYYIFLVALVLWYVLEYTPIGRYMYFTGDNVEVSRLSGIRTAWIKTGAFVAGAFICSLAGQIQAGTVGSADPTAAPSFMLPAFAGAFLGATCIKSGRFNSWGTVVASYLLVTGIVGLSMLGLSGWVEYVFNGGALVIAVAASRVATRAHEKKVQG